jgi:hypothetical protein
MSAKLGHPGHLGGGLVYDNELIVARFSGAQLVDSSILRVSTVDEGRGRERGHTVQLQLNSADIVRRSFENSGV